MSIISDIVAEVTEVATDLINFDDINVTSLKTTAEKFGVWDEIVSILPAEVKAKIEDGTLTDEEVKEFIPKIKEIIIAKISGSADSLDATTEAAAEVVEEAAA